MSDRPSTPRRSRGLLARWEALEGGQQAAIAFPVLVVVISLLHWGPLSQPFLRGLLYGLFWALPATAAVVVATAHERRKRSGQAPGDDA